MHADSFIPDLDRPQPPEAASRMDLLIRIIMFKVSCRDLGVDCEFVSQGADKEDVAKRIIEHGKAKHGMKGSPEERDKIMAAMKEE